MKDAQEVKCPTGYTVLMRLPVKDDIDALGTWAWLSGDDKFAPWLNVIQDMIVEVVDCGVYEEGTYPGRRFVIADLNYLRRWVEARWKETVTEALERSDARSDRTVACPECGLTYEIPPNAHVRGAWPVCGNCGTELPMPPGVVNVPGMDPVTTSVEEVAPPSTYTEELEAAARTVWYAFKEFGFDADNLENIVSAIHDLGTVIDRQDAMEDPERTEVTDGLDG